MAMRDQTDACLNDCTAAELRRWSIRVGVELCDDGALNVDTDGCPNDCQRTSRLRRRVSEGYGGSRDDELNANDRECLRTCKLAVCGDGLILKTWATKIVMMVMRIRPMAVSVIVVSRCGDGHVRADVEACDDGNR